LNDRDRPDPIGKLEETLALHKFAPKPKDALPSIDEVLEQIEAEHKKLGEEIELLKRLFRDSTEVMNTASSALLNLIRMQSK
jgi:hypothetical protein